MSKHWPIAKCCFQIFTTGNVVQIVLLSQYILTTQSCPNPHPSKCGEQKLQTDSMQVCLCIQSQNSSAQQTAIWPGGGGELSERATSGFMIIKLVQLSIFGHSDKKKKLLCPCQGKRMRCALFVFFFAKFFSNFIPSLTKLPNYFKIIIMKTTLQNGSVCFL